MEINWVKRQNEDSLKNYFISVHNVVKYLEEQQKQGVDFSYKKDYVDIIFEQDRIAQDNPEAVNYHLLAAALWVVLFKNDDARKELDEKYGAGFSQSLGQLSEFKPDAANLFLDQSFELPKGDYIITDPFYFENKDVKYLKNWLEDNIPSIHMHDTLDGNWDCVMFRMGEGQTFDAMSNKERKGAVYGRFSGEDGQVCVASLKDVAKYNKEFAERIEKACSDNPMSGRCATIIRNFKGTCTFEIKETFYKVDRKTLPSGYALHVVFDGVDTYTDLPVRYESRPLAACNAYLQMW